MLMALAVLGSLVGVALLAMGGPKLGVVMLAGIIFLPILVASIFNLRIGVLVIIILSFFLLGVKRSFADDVPLGLVMDTMIALMGFGLFVNHIGTKDWSWAKNPITRIVLVWIIYNLIEVANPAAASRLAWVYTVRSMAGFMVMYFIILYAINSVKYISLLMKVWIGLAMLGALYGFWQEFVGFSDSEYHWIISDPRRYGLLYIMGRFRKFSFFSDPMVFGFVMAYTSMLCFILATGRIALWKRIFLVVCGACMIVAMLYSGTRAAYVLLPVGLFFYALLTFRKQVLMVSGLVFMLGVVVILVPSGNVHIVRLQSAFKPAEDASYNVRKKNQAFIQPYIQTHPMGGGLGSVGVWGEKFSPESPLSKFPPDSGFVRIAVELGWVGLALYCTLLFVVFIVGVTNHFQLKSHTLRTYSVALHTVLYMLVIANFPQEAIGQIPTSLIFFACIAMINKLKDFDTPQLPNVVQTKRARLGVTA